MSKRQKNNESDNPDNDAGSVLTEFINAVFRGQITIYNPATGRAYDFDSFTEARDIIYAGNYSTEPPSNNGHK